MTRDMTIIAYVAVIASAAICQPDRIGILAASTARWVLDRFNQAAAELGVTDFVVPLEEGGALCLLSLAWMSMCRRLHRRTWIG